MILLKSQFEVHYVCLFSEKTKEEKSKVKSKEMYV